MIARDWERDLCTCGHDRAAHRKRRPAYPASVCTRGRCGGGCGCREFDIDAVELGRAEAVLIDARRTAAREFAAEMGWTR